MKKIILLPALFLSLFACNNNDVKNAQPKCETVYMNWSISGKNLGMASIFSPNGDGRNDLLRVFGATDVISSFEMVVSNSNGTEIFKTSDTNTPWDGLDSHSSLQPTGIYSIKVNMTISGETKQFFQCVYLVRNSNYCVDASLKKMYVFEDQFDIGTCVPVYSTGEQTCP